MSILSIEAESQAHGLRCLRAKASQAGRHCAVRLRVVSSDGTQTGGGSTPFWEYMDLGRQRTGSQALCLLPAVDTTLGMVFHMVCLVASHWS